MISLSTLYSTYDREVKESARRDEIISKDAEATNDGPAISRYLVGHDSCSPSDVVVNGFYRMKRCRTALDAIDRAGWKRSYFQRKFHDAFMASCARAFFKLDSPGEFQRSFQRILEASKLCSCHPRLSYTPRGLSFQARASIPDSATPCPIWV